MALIERNQVKAPSLPRETVAVPAMGGDVIVRGLLLSERLELSGFHARLVKPLDGESEEQARSRAGGHLVSFTLARAVELADGKPLFSQAEWDTFGAEHGEAVLGLFQRANLLGGQDIEAAAKN
jgi:hypothetical protein